jgi:uncharacterized membrane protein
MAQALPGRISRESSIDFARGAAMLLVFLAHFSEEQWVPAASSGVLLLIHRLAMIASPTFVIVSGLTLAFVVGRTRSDALPQRKLLVFDRALLMLLVVHAILVCTDDLFAPHARGMRQFFITDLVGLNLLLGLILLPHTSRAVRLTLAAGLYLTGWAVHLLWHPLGIRLATADEILSGPSVRHVLDYGFPVLQWAGVFLVGTVLGDMFSQARTREARRVWALGLIRRGASIAALGVMLKGLVYLPAVKAFLAAHPDYAEVFSLFGKLPPGPLYLMLFGGVGVCLVASATLLSLHATSSRAVEWVMVLGRNSLIAFILQSAVFRDAVARIPLGTRPWTWPFAFAASTLLIWCGTWIWDRLDGNRWLTLGLGRRVGEQGAGGQAGEQRA